MNQVWHIFRKDTRHFWREIVVLFALLIVYAWNEVRSWTHPGFGATAIGSVWGFYGALPGLVGVLIPITWLLLVIRIVHDEALVGDRQFWITRPYEWRALLAEKIVFLVAFINIPLFVLQVYLLTAANFRPQHHLVGLLAVQITILTLLVLSVFCLSTITRSIPQFLFASVAVLLYLIGISYLDSQIPNSNFGSSIDGLQIGVALLTPVAVILIQYSRRRTVISRLLFAGLAVILVLFVIIAPHQSFINKEYPPRQSAALMVTLPTPQTVDREQNEGQRSIAELEKVPFVLMMRRSEVGADSIVKLLGQMITVDSNSGLHWDSGWTPLATQLYSEQAQIPVNFGMDRKLFDRIKNSPVKLTVSFLYRAYVDEDRRNFEIPNGSFTIPEIGRCAGMPYSSRNIACLAALRRQVNLLITTDVSASSCPLEDKETPATPGTIARHWEYRESKVPEPGISPIEPVNISVVQMNWNPLQRRFSGGLCPGTSVLLSHPRLLYQAQQSQSFENVDLTKYIYGRGSLFGLRAIPQ